VLHSKLCGGGPAVYGERPVCLSPQG